jgi:ubiquitin-protein ligase E3 C
MFNQQEIATLVGGTDEPVDVEDLRRNTVRFRCLPFPTHLLFPLSFFLALPRPTADTLISQVYAGWPADENTPTITAFWDAVRSFDAAERAALVRFVTSCERPPLLGFGQLNPLFAIRNAGADQERLPTRCVFRRRFLHSGACAGRASRRWSRY